MRKLKQFTIVLLVCSTLLLAGFLVWKKLTLDVKPPVISCPEGILEISVRTGEFQAMDGVTARDDQDGDVSQSLAVEKLSSLAEDGTRIITYAAIDAAGNVGRAHRTVRYTDYEPPRFQLTAPLRFSVNAQLSRVLEPIRAASPLDGDLTSRIKYVRTDELPLNTPGFREIELRVTDSAGITTTLPMTVELYHPEQEQIKVSLKEYLLYLPAGAPFDPMDWFDQSVPGGTLRVDYHPEELLTPGLCTVDYIVTSGQKQGLSRLVILVENPDKEEQP